MIPLDEPSPPEGLQTEEQYQGVMAEIDRLILAEPRTPEAERLEFLLELACNYEQQHHSLE